jgi:hypothetical protein
VGSSREYTSWRPCLITLLYTSQTNRALSVRVLVDQKATSPPVLPFWYQQRRGTVLPHPNQCSGTYLLNHLVRMEPCDWSNARRESGMVFAAFRSTRTLIRYASFMVGRAVETISLAGCRPKSGDLVLYRLVPARVGFSLSKGPSGVDFQPAKIFSVGVTRLFPNFEVPAPRLGRLVCRPDGWPCHGRLITVHTRL